MQAACVTSSSARLKSPSQGFTSSSSLTLFQNLKTTQSLPRSHSLSQPSSCLFQISLSNPTKQCKGTVGQLCPYCPLMLPQRRRGEASRPVDQQLNFILNGTQHPGSMKWSLIIKLKSLSAEQFKWRQLSVSLFSSSVCLPLSLSPASTNLIENPHSSVLYRATVLQSGRLIYPKNGVVL